MAKFTDYTEKTEPVDTDLALIYDTPAKVNKKFTFGNLWKWIAKKIVSEGISQLETTNKTIPGAINELNSKSKFYWTYDAVSKFIQIVFEKNNSDHLYFDTYDIVQFRFNNKEIRCSARTYSTQNWSVIWTK